MKQWHFWLRQPLHGFLLLLLCVGLWLASRIPGFPISHSLRITVRAIVIVSVILGVMHQLWVLIFWRLELGSSIISRYFGASGFTIFGIGFGIFITGRFLSIVYLAPINRGTLPIAPAIRLILVGIIAVFNLWGMYSVLRYFGIRRALGLDHFDVEIRDGGLVKGGAYRYMNNVMYLIVVPVFFAPGLVWGSVASIVLAGFHYLYVWVHFYCTELPDMSVIYRELD
jgi:hypothetical protein